VHQQDAFTAIQGMLKLRTTPPHLRFSRAAFSVLTVSIYLLD